MDIDELSRTLDDEGTNTKVLLELAVLNLAETRATALLVSEFLSGGIDLELQRQRSLYEKLVATERVSIINHLYTLYGHLPPDIFEK